MSLLPFVQGVPPETQFLLTELEEGGPYALIVPLISDCRFRGTLRPPP
jgi:raffinose synthase